MPGFVYRGYLIPDARLDETIAEFGKSIVDVIGDEWRDTLKAMRETILKSVLLELGTAEKYRNVMLNRALPKLGMVFNPNWPKYSKALRKFRAKQAKTETFEKFYTNFTEAMKEGGLFEQRVDEGEKTFEANVRIVLRTVGVKQLVLGPARKLHMIIIGDRKVVDYLDPTIDSFEGEVDYYVDPAIPAQAAQAVIPAIVETITYAFYLHTAGLEQERDQELQSGSQRLLNLLKRIVDPAKVSVDNINAVIGYDAERDDFYIEVSFPAVQA